MNYEKLIPHIFAGFSQFLHACCLGYNDVSISGSMYFRRFEKPFKWLRKYIDFTFYFIEGENHCQRAYEADRHENYDRKPNKWLITITVLFWCTLINLILLALSPFIVIRNVLYPKAIKIWT